MGSRSGPTGSFAPFVVGSKTGIDGAPRALRVVGSGVTPRSDTVKRGPDRHPMEGMDSVTKQVKQLDRVIIRFAGDSGDGMQLTGDRFTQETASFGNDLSTLPNFPAEIRAPQGTLPGVSSFQVHFADHD